MTTTQARETAVFRAAMAVVAVAVLDDAFVHREPGTSIADHLEGGLVPVVVALALAVLHPRLRAGWRGAAALACGVWAMTAGVVDGLRHVLVDRLSGDDLTALLSLAAGAVLAGLGVAVLWRARRRDERPARRYARRALVGLGGLVAVYLVVLPVGIALLATHKARAPVAAVRLGAPAQAVRLTTADGLRLAASYVPSRNGAAVIVFPGRTGTARHARMLVRHGYGVLVLDRRGEGASEGDYSARGWGGEPDLRAAIAWLQRRPDVRAGRIGGLGLSVGGELLLQAAAHDSGLRAVVSEGAGRRSLAEQMHTPDVPKAIRWISPMTLETVAEAVLGNDRPPPDLVDLMPLIAPRPVLLIAARDGNADEELNRVYLDAAGASTALWELPRGGHTGGLAAAPRAYERRVVGFLDRALLAGERS